MTIKFRKFDFTSVEKMFIAIWTLYSVSYFVLGSELSTTYSIVNTIQTYITYLTILLQLAMFFVINQYKYSELLRYVAVIGVAFLIELSNSSSSFLVMVLFIILAQHIDFDKLLRYDLMLKLFMLFVIVGMCMVGITDNYSALINGTYKQAMGFAHPNTFTCYVLMILMEFLCVKFKNMKVYDWIITFAGLLIVYSIGGGRSSIYTFVVICFVYIIATVFPRLFKTRLVRLMFTCITPIMAVISFIMAYLYSKGNTIVIALDSVLTNRIYLMSRFFKNYSITLFGQNLNFVSSRSSQRYGTASNILDNAYARCLLLYGLIAFVFVMVAYCILMRKLINSERFELAVFCLFFVILGFGESYMLNVCYNLSLMCLLGVKDVVKQSPEKEAEIYKIKNPMISRVDTVHRS